MDQRLLIRRACEGDESAFRALYDENVDRVYRLAYRMTGDEEAAQECTQEAFIQAFQKLGSFRGGSRFSTWIHSITANVTLNRLRRHKRNRSRELPLEGREASPDGHAMQRTARTSDPTLKDKIRLAVDSLPDIYRTVFLMHDLEGYKHTEIADALKIAVGTSKARLSRARSTLRSALGDEMREYVS